MLVRNPESKQKPKPFVNPFKKDAQHIKALSKFKDNAVDPLQGENKIYFLETLEKTAFYKDAANMGKIKSFDSLAKVGKRLIKVGDTKRLVDERNDETLTNASLHREIVSSTLAIKEDGTTFRDKEFHTFLENKGYERELNDNGNPSEFFFFDSLEQAQQEFEEFTAKKFTEQVVLRTVQHYGLDLLAEATDAGYTKINFGSCMRSGKTIMSLVHAKGNNCMPVYIGKNLTSQSSADDDNNEYGIVEYMTTVSIHGQDEYTDGEMSRKVREVIDTIVKANVNNQYIILYIDECDDASHTAKSRLIIKQVAEYFHKLGMLFQVVTMSGTRKERGTKILQDLSFMPGKIKELSIEYWEMQILQPEDTVKRNFVNIGFFNGNAHNLVNIADALKDRTVGHASIASFIKELLSPTNNFELKDTSNHPHWFLKFCTTEKSPVTDLAKYLNANLSKVAGKEFMYIPINGDTTSSREAQKFCKKVIKDNPTKIVVFLSFGMATTSFSVVPIGNAAVFSDNPITADDTQAFHRGATWETGKEWCNMVYVTTTDGTELAYNDVFERELPVGKKQGKLPIFKEILHLNSLIHISAGVSTTPMNIIPEMAEHVLDARAKAQTKVASVMHMLKEHDDIKDIILEVVDPKSGKLKKVLKSGTAKGDTKDPFGVLQNRNRNQKQTGLTVAKQEAILRAFATNAVNVPAVAVEQEVTLEDFDFWDEVGVDADLFEYVCNESEDFKETIETIYRLCKTNETDLQKYLDKTMI